MQYFGIRIDQKLYFRTLTGNLIELRLLAAQC